jgi:hypothetical protein
MALRIRPAPVALVVVAAIALMVAHRGEADAPASAPAVVAGSTSSPSTQGVAAAPVLTVGPNGIATIRQAVQTAGTGPCVIRVAAGRHDVGGLVIGPGGPMRIVGTRGSSGSQLDDSTVFTGPVKFTGRDVTLTDLIFDAPPAPNLKPGTSAVDTLVTIEKAPHVEVDRCLFTGSADTALKIDRCGGWSVTSSLFDNIYRGLFATTSSNGRLINCTLIDDRLGHGTNSLTTGRIEIRDSNHLVLFNNALSPRDPDGKVLLLDGCGNDIKSDYNIWNGVITHQYGTEQQSTWQNSFRTLDRWQAHTAAMWGSACDQHSHSEPISYCNCPIPEPDSKAFGETSGAGTAAAQYQGCSSPATDFFGRPTDHSVGCFDLVPPKVLPPWDPMPGVRVFSTTFPTAGRASVAVYSGDWLLQTLASGELFDAGEHRFVWDGRDASGHPVQPGRDKITWRAVLTPESPETFDIAGPGMKLAPGCTGTTLANNPQENGEGIWCDKDGNLYEVAPYDEAGSTILSVDKDGHYRWRNWQHNGHLVTGDDKYIYVIGDDKVEKNAVVVERFPLAGCDPVPWADGKIGLTLGTPDDLDIKGIAALNGKLCVCDGRQKRVLVYASGSNVVEREIKIPGYAISGLAALVDGSLMTCRFGNPGMEYGQRTDLVRITPGGTATTVPTDGGFGGLGLTAGPDKKVYVFAAGSVSRRDADGHGKSEVVLTSPQWDDHGGQSGMGPFPIQPITYLAGSDQSLWVRQKEPGYARCTLTRYDRQPDGRLKPAMEILSLEGQNGSFADPRDPSFIYSPDFFRYHVDLTTAKWDWDRNYQDIRGSTVRQQVGCSTGAIFYIGDKKFMASTVCNSDTTNSRTVLICRFIGEVPYPCAAIGGKYFGAGFQVKDFDQAKSGQWVWTAIGNHRDLRPDETTFVKSANTKDGYPFPDLTWGTYVERDGTIVWPGESMHYLRPRGLDKTGSVPVYDWSDVVTIKYQGFPERDEKYTARVDLDGSIYDLSATKHDPLPPGYWGMGTVLTRLTPAGRRVWSVPVNLTAKGLAIDDNFVYVGSCFGPFISQYTKDGLLVRTFSWGRTDSQFGWFDFPTPINSVTDPKTGDSILTAEEQWMGRIMVFKVPGAVTRLSGEVPN